MQEWMNGILTLLAKTDHTETCQKRATMNGTISQFYKGGSTNKSSDQRPVVLLNSVYQLLNYIINKQENLWSRRTCWNLGKAEAGKADE